MKRKGDIRIGKRMIEEIYRLFPGLTLREIANRLGFNRKQIYEWQGGKTPGGYYLAKILAYGGDVIYILSGKRQPQESADDFLAEYEEEYD